MGRNVILFELNEVPVRIFKRFCDAHPRSTLGRIIGQCWKYETYTEDKGWLEPWITWPTLHRGVASDRHAITDFGQNLESVDRDYPPIWNILASHGIPIGICGSLHTYPMPDDLSSYSFLLPDTFAAGSECFPQDMEVFQEFNLRMARASARNVSRRVPWQSALRLLAKAPHLGFKVETAMDLGGQLAAECVHPLRRVRRRTYQAVLAFDVFMKYLNDTKPALATFFTNHVASSMHRYWAALFPGDYEEFGLTDDWVRDFKDEIDFTMSKFDHLLARLKRFVDDNPAYQLWIVTSMGQAATEARPCQSQLYCVDPHKFMAAMGVVASEWSSRPAMLPQFNVVVAGEKAAAFRHAISRVRIDGRALRFREDGTNFFSLDFGHERLSGKSDYILIDDRIVSEDQLGLRPVEIEDQTFSNAYHIPNGTLLIYDPKDSSIKPDFTQISTLEIAPTLLKTFSIRVPDYMCSPAPLSAQQISATTASVL